VTPNGRAEGLGTIGRANRDGSGVDRRFIRALDPMPAAVAAVHVYWVYGGNMGGNARSPSRDWCDGPTPGRNTCAPTQEKAQAPPGGS